MKVTNERFRKVLQCLECQGQKLEEANDQIVCSDCMATYPIAQSVPFLLSKQLAGQLNQYHEEINQPINKFKTFLKQNPRLFQFLKRVVGSVSFFGQMPKQTIKKIYTQNELASKIIINLGSGTRIINKDIINSDLFPFTGVNFVCDATALPFHDNSVDMIISESTLEHIPDADRAIKEMCRVIKPGGYVYVSIPFLFPFHASPNDYFRLTHEGLKQKFTGFEPIKTGYIGGPASALVTFLMYFLALPFSLISKSAYDFATYFFMVILSPVRFLDIIFYLFPQSIEVAAVVYFVGKKRTE